MKDGEYYKNERTGEKTRVVKVMQSDWDTESDPEKIKDFYAFINVPNIETENGDILTKISKEEFNNN